MKPSEAAPKKLVAKASAKKKAAKAKPRRQMTVALAEKRAVGSKDGRKVDSLAMLRELR